MKVLDPAQSAQAIVAKDICIRVHPNTYAFFKEKGMKDLFVQYWGNWYLPIGKITPQVGRMLAGVYIPTDSEFCFEDYVVWSDFVYTYAEWEHSGLSEKYDDVKHCRVNVDHPDYPNKDGEGWDQFETDMLKYWSSGVKPTYVE